MNWIFASARFFLFDFLNLKMCWDKIRINCGLFKITIPIPGWCKWHYWPILELKGPLYNILLFKVQTGPYDVTPPTTGEVAMSQANEERVVITHSGFNDKDSEIDRE